jgi:hypothetical protein
MVERDIAESGPSCDDSATPLGGVVASKPFHQPSQINLATDGSRLDDHGHFCSDQE